MKPPIIAAQNSPSTPTPQAPPSPNAARWIGKSSVGKNLHVCAGRRHGKHHDRDRAARSPQAIRTRPRSSDEKKPSVPLSRRPLEKRRNGKQTTEGASNVAHSKQDGQLCPHVAAHRGGIRDGAAIRLPRDLIPMCINVGNKLPTPPCFLVEESCRVSF